MILKMNRAEAEDFVYRSYLKAEKYHDYYAKDSEKRNPELTRDIIREKAGTPCVVVTGSKGKGSVANMVSQILQSSYKVGLMTSPHIYNICERFKINGQNMSDDDFVRYLSVIKPEIEAIDQSVAESVCVSPMGIQADLALTYFNANHTDFNVMECGKGAKFDDVNNVKHDYAVINSIVLEHVRELGDTIEAIADDKSYVINGEQDCVYVAEQKPEVIAVIKKRADAFGTPVKIYGVDFEAVNIRYGNAGMLFDAVIGEEIFENISVPLMGAHQARNCALAMALCQDVLHHMDAALVKKKLAETNWPGRLEVLSSDPFMMLDACINSASCKDIIDVMYHLDIDKATVIIGIPNDKDYAGVVRAMSAVASHIILTRARNPHYVFTKEQCGTMLKEGIRTLWTDSVEEAIRRAKEFGQPVVILGTTALVAEVKNIR